MRFRDNLKRRSLLKVLFIGGTGNISTDCAALLCERGHEISVVTRGNISVPKGYKAIKADRKDVAGMRKALRKEYFDVVINFLGYVVPDIEIDYELFKGRTDQYIFISTAMVYARPHVESPIRENASKGNIYSDYAKEKEKCETYLMERSANFPCTIVRPSHTYSKRWIPNVVSSKGYTVAARLEAGKPLFVPNDGENLWTLTATTDFAVGLAGLAGNEQAIGKDFHITSDEALTWNRIYREIASAVGVDDPKIIPIPSDFICEVAPDLVGAVKGDKMNQAVFDNSKLKSFVPDFVCRKPFSEGIREAVSFMREHPEEKALNPEADEKFDTIIRAWQTRHQQ